MELNQSLLFLSFIGVGYSYFLYPLFLLLLPKEQVTLSTVSDIPPEKLPTTSIIITAFNEESRIREKLNNTLELQYPADKIEILVASDGSTDNTAAIVREYSELGVQLIEVKERKGKEHAQLVAIQQSTGDILIFSDVATQIPSPAITHIVSAFSNPKVGAVSSEDRFLTQDGKIAGEAVYVKYEMWLRRLEARTQSLVGLSGSFFACRREICQDWDISVPSDFNTALSCVQQGMIAISHPEVLGYYSNLQDEQKEYQRKLRTVIRGMTAIKANPQVLNPFTFGIFSLQVFSHKIMRWLVPWFMLLLLFTTINAWHVAPLYRLLLIGQLVFYGLAISGWLIQNTRKLVLFKIPFFFMQANLAIAHAGFLFLAGRRIIIWEPSKR